MPGTHVVTPCGLEVARNLGELWNPSLCRFLHLLLTSLLASPQITSFVNV
jgi:hypothetical protein